MIYALGTKTPRIHPDAWIAPTATVIGDVVVEAGASIWWNAVVRGDDEQIVIGPKSNVQDGCVLHADAGMPLVIGANVTVGHMAMLHGCTIKDGALVGIGSVVMNRAVIGEGTIVGAGALVTEGKQFPPNVLVVGSPAAVKRELSDLDGGIGVYSGSHYVAKSLMYRAELTRLDD